MGAGPYDWSRDAGLNRSMRYRITLDDAIAYLVVLCFFAALGFVVGGA